MKPHHTIGRYALYDAIASGGMATVYYGVLGGPVGFARTVAIKQLHPRFARDPDFVSMFIDEAQITAHIRHPNVVPVLDVVKHGRELYVVMEYVVGVSLALLLSRARSRGRRMPVDVAVGIVCGCLEGLHAAHEVRDEKGEPRGIIHRDVSPANVLVGRDGTPRVLDFGLATAARRTQITRTGQVKGKLGYMAPEQLRGEAVTLTTDVHAVSVVLWEALVGARAYAGKPFEVLARRQQGRPLPPVSHVHPDLARLDEVLARGLAPTPAARWPSARAMAEALRAVERPASPDAIAAWVMEEAGELIDQRERKAASLEAGASPTLVRAAIRADWRDDTPVLSIREIAPEEAVTLRRYLELDDAPTLTFVRGRDGADRGESQLTARREPDFEDQSATWRNGRPRPPRREEGQLFARYLPKRSNLAALSAATALLTILLVSILVLAGCPAQSARPAVPSPPVVDRDGHGAFRPVSAETVLRGGGT
ncbi:MAG: serine/threonine protein kinase [Deltaproteobacteria bacterium]|jgi:serine/threonine-protein kinase|nr:serine/threonine protein kinase [Deltaproteobacteria bacterium]MBW2530936.1 serine/threonine protein kinase [Deltaproteobacteria bacterium]